MNWPAFLRDPRGTIVLEEVDEDTRTATYRVYGRTSIAVTETGREVVFDGEPPAALRAALVPRSFGRLMPASERT